MGKYGGYMGIKERFYGKVKYKQGAVSDEH